MKPVELTILMRDKTREGIQSASENVDGLTRDYKELVAGMEASGEAAKSMASTTSQSLEGLKSTLQALKSQQRELQSVMSDSSKWGAVPKELTAEYEKISQEIKEAETRIGAYSKKTEEVTQSHVSFRSQLRQAREELIAMEQAGQRGTKAYADLQKRVGQLQDAMDDAAQQARVLANDESAFQGFITGLSGVAGGFSAATGAMALFSGENENLQKIMLKVQSLMAITVGLQQVSQALNKDSAFRLVTVAKAQEFFAIATNKLSVALGISNIAAKALMATLTMGLSVVIGGIIYLWDKYSSAQAKASEEQQKFNKAVAENAAQNITGFEKLRQSYNKLGDSIEEKTKFLIANQEEFRKLGIQINNVNDLNNVFIENADAFKQSIMARASAMAAMELATEHYKKALEKRGEAKERAKNPTLWDEFRGSTVLSAEIFAANAAVEFLEEAKTEEQLVKDLIGESIRQSQEAQKSLSDANIQSLDNLEKSTKAWWEGYKKTQEQQMENSLPGSDVFKKAKAERDRAAKELKKWDEPKDSDNAKQQNEKLQKRLEAQEKLSDIERAAAIEREKFQLEMRQKEIDVMDDSYKKQQQQLELNLDKELLSIREFEQKKLHEQQQYEKEQWQANGKKGTFKPKTQTIDELKKADNKDVKYIVPDIADQIKQQTKAAQDAYDKASKDLLEARRKELSEEEYHLKSSLDRQLLEIKQNYEERIKAAKGNSLLESELKKNFEADLVKAKKTASLEQISAEEGYYKELTNVTKNAATANKKRLDETIKKTKELIKYIENPNLKLPAGISEEFAAKLKESPDALREMYENLNLLQDEYNSKQNYPFAGFIKGLSDLKNSSAQAKKALQEIDAEKRKMYQNQADISQKSGVEGIKAGAIEAAETTQFLSEKLQQLADVTGDAAFQDFADETSAIARNFSAAGQGAASGGWIGAIVGGATDILSQTIEAFTQAAASEAEAKRNAIDFANAYQLSMLQIKDIDYESVFGTNDILKSSDAFKKAQETIKEYNKLTNSTNVQKGINNKSIVDQILAAGAIEKGFNDLQSMKIKTKTASGWSKFWGGSDKYTSLGDLAPQLWNERNEFDTENAKLFLETNTQISDEQRKQIQYVIDLKQAYDDAMSLVDEQIEKVFGSLATDMADSIFDAVRNGSDAWEGFEKTGLSVIDSLGKELLKEMIIGTYLDNYKEKMRSAYSLGDSEQIQEELLKITGSIFNGLPAIYDSMESVAKNWEEMAQDAGFDTSKLASDGVSQSGKAGAFTTMSQEQGTKLEGLFTSLQMHGANIDDTVKNISAAMYVASDTLMRIETNTSHCRRLEDLADNMAVLLRDGLKVR
ncbi:hypothetical protein FACS1894199_11580 [Bacteroidia bacterium]|nr:hypothetical protein FACS1894199_11580 [Bacteroidia bacterium]